MSALSRRLLLMIPLLVSARALANGRFPAAQQVVFGLGEHARRVTFRVTFGLLVSDDDARSFHWLCEEAMYSPSTPGPALDPAVEIDAEGRTLFGYGGGVRAWSPDACGVRVLPALASREVIDLAVTADHRTVYGVETTPGARQWVLRASSGDLAFSRRGEGIAGVRLSTLDVAPGNPERLFVAGLDDATRAPVVFRSDDGGETLTAIRIAGELLGDEAFVAGVDPLRADAFWLRTNIGLGSSLLRVRGASSEVVARTSDAMLGFARGSDGRSVWYGSAAEGLHRSTDGGDSFERVNTLAVYCLASRGEVLWACGDWLRGAFALGRSHDGGRSFEPVLRFEDIAGPARCAGEGDASCEPRWPTLRDDLLTPTRRDAGARDAGARDAGARDDLGALSPSCACAAATKGRGRGARCLVGCALAWLSLVRRRSARGRA